MVTLAPSRAQPAEAQFFFTDPDLKVTSIKQVSFSALRSMTFTVTNTGGFSAGPFTVAVKSGSATGSTVQTFAVSGLAPGKSQSFVHTVYGCAATTRTVVLDSTKAVWEGTAGELNNTASLWLEGLYIKPCLTQVRN
jgi:hypothetical protein